MLGVIGLGALALAVYARYILQGGFYLDDWSNGAATLASDGGVSGTLQRFSDLTDYRPVLILYVPATFWVFGTHMGLHIAWSIFLVFVVGVLVMSVATRLGLARLHAFAFAALTVVYPWYDGARLWSTASMATLVVGLVTGGLLAALIGLERGRARWHVLAAVLFLTSIFTYELCLALIPCFGLLYLVHSGWGRARLRWAADIGVAFVGVAWVVTQSPRAKENDLGGLLDRGRDVAEAGGTVLGRSVLPLGDERTGVALLAIVVVFAGGLLLRGRLRAAGKPADAFLVMGAFGFITMVAGWALFVPADPYYTPSLFGFTTRVNALAGFGAVAVTYAAAGLIGSSVSLLAASRTQVATAATLAIALGVAGSYTIVLNRHIDHWVTAFELEMGGIGQMRGQFPDLPDGSTVFASGYPAYQTLGVPVWATSWDLDGAIRLQYHNPTLRAYPVVEGIRISCEADGVKLLGAGYEGQAVTAYGKAVLLDLGTGRNAVPQVQSSCRTIAPAFVPGPLYLSYKY